MQEEYAAAARRAKNIAAPQLICIFSGRKAMTAQLYSSYKNHTKFAWRAVYNAFSQPIKFIIIPGAAYCYQKTTAYYCNNSHTVI